MSDENTATAPAEAPATETPVTPETPATGEQQA